MVPHTRLSRSRLLALATVVMVSLSSDKAFGEERSSIPASDVWTFYEAWRVYRYDLEATLPGEHGSLPLVERLHDEPLWLTRDGLRQARSPEALAFLARRVARRGDLKSISALRRAGHMTPNEQSRRALERALIRLGDESTQEKLARRLREGSPAERRQAATTLAAAGQKAAPPLSAALEHPDIQTQIAAASVLAAQGNRREGEEPSTHRGSHPYTDPGGGWIHRQFPDRHPLERNR